MNDPVGDDDLQAYVDGQLPSERCRVVEAWLVAHPDEAERLRSWREQNEGLHRLFDPVLDEAIPASLHPAYLRGRRVRAWRLAAWRVAAAFLLLVVGTAAGWWLRGQGSDMAVVAAEALSAHRVYVADQRRPVEVPGSEREQMTKWLSRRLGAPMTIPDLSEAGFQLVGGRLLPASNGAAALYMYENGAGLRLTLYVRRAEPGDSYDLRFRGREGTLAGIWEQGAFGCALSGELPQAQLEPLARQVWQQMGRDRVS